MTALIGTREHAIAALDYSVAWEGEEFSKVGQGSYRIALLHIATQVVYKVERGMYGGNDKMENLSELNNSIRLREMAYPDGWWSTHVRIPIVSGFKIDNRLIIAMPFIGGVMGNERDWSGPQGEDMQAELRSLGLWDMHGLNYKVDVDGVIWPIDLASPCEPKTDFQYPSVTKAEKFARTEKARAERVARGERATRIQKCECGCSMEWPLSD